MKSRIQRPTKRIGYSVAALLVLASPWVQGVSKVWAATTWTETDLTGSGSFTQPFAIAVDSSADVFVTNQNSSSPAVEELKNGTWTDLTLTGGGTFSWPSGIALDSHGNVFVTNENNATVPAVEELTNGTWKDLTNSGTFSQPYGIAVDSTGDLFVTNAGSNTIEELPNGTTTWQNISGSGSFNQPQGIAVDSTGDLFVTNYGNGTIEELSSNPGSTWKDITGTGGSFKNPIGITVDGTGDLFVADSFTNALAERPSGTSTWTSLSGNGVFMSPAGIAVDSAGNLYVSNTAASTGGVGGGPVPGGGGGLPTISAVVKYTPALAAPTAPVAPSAPTGLSASGTTSTGTTLAWNTTSGATSYNVYENNNGTPIATGVTSTSYNVTGLTSGTSYSFTVSAVNSGGESPQSSSVTVNTTAATPSAPSAPTGLSASGTTSTGTTLAWNTTSGATSYNVYENNNGTPIATGVTSTTYMVTGLTAGTPYSFTVSAVNSGGESPQSSSVTVNTTAVVTPPKYHPPILSNNTQIQDTPSDSQKFVWSVDNTSGSLSVSVVNGTTATQLTGAIESTNGSVQTYAVQDGKGQTVSGSTPLTSGDVLVVTATDGSTTATYTISTWMEVSTAAQLEQIDKNQGNYLNANIKLMSNIDLTGYSGWIPFGGNSYGAFSGTFDGQGHTISGLAIDGTGTTDSAVGFFGETSGTIKNVGIDATVKGGTYTGDLVGEQTGGSISDSYATGSVRGGDGPGSATGGLVGYLNGGSDFSVSISDCYATGTVTGGNQSSTGGLAGEQNGGNITHGYATGSVRGGTYIGGVLGNFAGGIFGFYNYFDTDTAGQSSGVGGDYPPAVQAASDSAMKKQSTFHGWDFQKIWGISPSVNGGYPYLRAFVPQTASNNTQIQDRQSDSQKYMWSVDNTNGSSSVSVVNGTTMTQFTGAIQSTDGSTQTYAVRRAGQAISGSSIIALKDGDVLVVTAADGQTIADYTVSTWMEVSTAAQLEQIDKNQSNYMNANIKLMNDINLTDYSSWMPIFFAGTFDGQGHEITGLTINQTSVYAGFFGISSGTIENLGVDVAVSGGNDTGGLVGQQNGGSISNSYATGTVTGSADVGGLVGYQKSGSISDSYANVIVSGSQSSSGGLSSALAYSDLGGLVGLSDNGNITDSYAIGKVFSSQSSGGDLFGLGPQLQSGGLVGESQNGITGSYFDTDTTGQSSGGTATGSVLFELGLGGSLTGVTGESDSAMKKQSTFQGWDFTKTWAILPTLNGGYPYLRAFTPKASTANDTQIQDKKSDSQKYVWSVDNTKGSLSVSVVNGSTAAQLTNAIEATDGSAQTYAVQDGKGQTISGSTTLKDGDVLVVTSADGTVTADYTVSTWMEVSTAAQLEQIDKNQGNYLNANIRLMNDIDLTTQTTLGNTGYYTGWVPIGGNKYGTFTGTFDGQGHEITGLTISDPYGVVGYGGIGHLGFFGQTSGTIENLGLAVSITVFADHAGALAGEQDGGTITNSHAAGSVNYYETLNGHSTASISGGLVGIQNSGSINASYATVSVNDTTAGGLVGEQKGGSITASHASGAVNGVSALIDYMFYLGGMPSVAGGLVGSEIGGSIADSYATGTVSGDGPGGLVGSQTGGSISDSYATGKVTPGKYTQAALSQFPSGVGGIVGYQDKGTISGSYFDQDTTGQSNGVGKSTSSTQSPPTGVTGLSDADMKIQSTFQGWDFTNTWAISPTLNGGYPSLRALTPQTSTASQTFGSSGGTMQQKLGNQTVTVNVPDGAFQTQETVSLSLVPLASVSQSMQGLGTSSVAAVLNVSFSGVSPTKPVTVTITNSSIKAGGVVYKQTSDGKLVPMKATVVDGKATVSFTSDPTFVVLNVKQNERVITMAGYTSIVPGLAQAESAHGNKTTYMPIWYVMQLLKPLGIQSTWDGTAWRMTTPSQPNLSSLIVGEGRTTIYLNGTVVQKVDTVAATDPSTGKATAYMPIWYVMQLLKRVGLQSTWDGMTWSVSK